MEKMRASGHHRHRQDLRARPVHHVRQRYGVIELAMNHQGALVQVCRNLRHLKTAGRSPHQNQRPELHQLALLHQHIQRLSGHKGPKRKPGQGQRSFGRKLLNHRQKVLRLTNAVIMHPLGVTHPPEVEANRGPPLRHKGPGQGLNHLVVHGAAKQRVGVRNHDHTF